MSSSATQHVPRSMFPSHTVTLVMWDMVKYASQTVVWHIGAPTDHIKISPQQATREISVCKKLANSVCWDLSTKAIISPDHVLERLFKSNCAWIQDSYQSNTSSEHIIYLQTFIYILSKSIYLVQCVLIFLLVLDWQEKLFKEIIKAILARSSCKVLGLN